MTSIPDSLDGAAAQQPTVAFVTLGCAKNEVDTAHMKDKVLAAGYGIAEDPAEADAVVINTCSFIQAATEESIEAIFEAAGLPRVASGDAKLIVAGCMPARYGDDLGDELTEASAFVPCSKEDDIVEVLAQALGLQVQSAMASSVTRTSVSEYVKISDGCDRFCSYCTIPYIRGRYHSFPYQDIKDEVSSYVRRGTREIVLIAQDTGRWGTDFDEPLSLAWLVGSLAQAFPETWFRVMYLQPEGVTDEYLRAVADNDNVCSYFDIPLQHVDPDILRAMNRTGSRKEFEQLTSHIRSVVPQATLRTTLIAGFPGETDQQFDELCDFVENCDFDYIGVFAYSREEGTRSYDLPQQVEEDEKRYRAQVIRDLADTVCTPRIASRIGCQCPVLIESCEEDGQLFGRTQSQAPEVDGVTYVPSGEVGDILQVSITDSLMYEMEGELV